jgi:hypothetical protein
VVECPRKERSMTQKGVSLNKFIADVLEREAAKENAA